jgi:uncharacterized damage-inducible protein DinB
MNPRELLIDTIAYIPPARVLEGLAPEEAERHAPGATHSIAQIVAHILFWQNWFCRRLDGVHEPMVSAAALGWPEPAPGTWPELQNQFLVGLERVVAHGHPTARLDEPIVPAIEFPPLAHYTTGDALVHVAHHNGYHLGQVVLLRQLMGLWPPPSGSWTW